MSKTYDVSFASKVTIAITIKAPSKEKAEEKISVFLKASSVFDNEDGKFHDSNEAWAWNSGDAGTFAVVKGKTTDLGNGYYLVTAKGEMNYLVQSVEAHSKDEALGIAEEIQDFPSIPRSGVLRGKKRKIANFKAINIGLWNKDYVEAF